MQDRKTVLVVDDQKDVLEGILGMVESLGYWGLAASSGPEAIEEYQTHGGEIDLVMLDIIMPEMDGFRVYEELKKLNPRIIVLFSSGDAPSGKVVQILSMNRKNAAFIRKPFDYRSLGWKLAELI